MRANQRILVEKTHGWAAGRRRGGHCGSVNGLFAVILPFCLLFAAPNVFPATYYVDQAHVSASDANPGTEEAPWLTIQKAANTVVAGDTVIVKAATYEERISFSSGHSGTAEQKITFKAVPRRSVTIQGFFSTQNANYLRIEGFNITNDVTRYSYPLLPGGVRISSDYVEIVDNYFYDIPAYAIESKWSQPWRVGADVADNRIYRCAAGMSVYGDDWLVENNEIERLIYGGFDADYTRFFGNNITFRGNYFHGTIQAETYPSHTDGWQTFNYHGEYAHNVIIEGNIVEAFGQGVIIQNDAGQTTDISLSDITIRNNLFIRGESYPDGVWGVLADGVPNITVVHNVFINMQGAGVLYQDGTTGVVKNNIFYNSTANYFTDGQAFIDGGYNILWPGGAYGQPNDQVINPLLINPNNFLGADGLPFTADDGFGLQPGSPAIDAATEVGVTEDIRGIPRPQGSGSDIGPSEFLTGALPAIFVSSPSPAVTQSGPVTYTVTYMGADTVTLSESDVTLNTTGTATGTVSVSGSGTTTRTVTLSDITGDGTLTISIAAGTASDAGGNPAAAVGPSAPVSVDNTERSPDVNGDGVVNAVDIQLVINGALGLPTDFNCDINGDGNIDAIDMQLVSSAALAIPILIKERADMASNVGGSMMYEPVLPNSSFIEGSPIIKADSSLYLRLHSQEELDPTSI